MKLNVNNVNVSYIQYGSGRDIVLLHGWGQNIQMMRPLGDLFSNKYRITILDFPGFGGSDEPLFAYSIEDYTKFLHELLKKLDVKEPIIMGHSFGGRVAICYSALYKVSKVVLFGSPCIRKQTEFSLSTKVFKKLMKVPGLKYLGEIAKNYIGSDDYKNATPLMRDVLVKTVNEDLSKYAKKIKAPTLLVWGNLDTAAPIEDAYELEKIIEDAGMVVLDGCTHYAYLEQLPRVKVILDKFL